MGNLGGWSYPGASISPHEKPRNSVFQTYFHSQIILVLGCAKSLTHVQFFASPWIVAFQAPLSMEFHRQENWNELLLPSPCESKSESRSVMFNSLRPHGLYSPRNSLEWVAFPFSSGSSQPRDLTQVFCIAGGFFTSWATCYCINFPFVSKKLTRK